MPVEDAIKAFDELRSKGVFYTPAKSTAELTAGQWPIRVVGVPPTNPDKPSVVSFGPFALERERFEQLKAALEDPDVFRVALGFVRLEFEKTGLGATGQYQVEAEEDILNQFLASMAYWDIDHPIVGELFVWIVPTEECKHLAERITEKDYAEDDFSWWDVQIDLGEAITPYTAADYPDRYRIIPNELTDSWMRCLPSRIAAVLMFLYGQATRGGTFKSFGGLTEVLEAIEQGFEWADQLESGPGIRTTEPDRELLIKELYDHNNLPYPVDAATTLDYLQRVGFIVSKQNGTDLVYSLTEEPASAEKVLNIPPGWEYKMNKFLATGSVLFAYLSLEEIARD